MRKEALLQRMSGPQAWNDPQPLVRDVGVLTYGDDVVDGVRGRPLGYNYFAQALLPEYERTVAALPGLYYAASCTTRMTAK